MSGYKQVMLPVLIDANGRVIGFKELDGDETLIPTFSVNSLGAVVGLVSPTGNDFLVVSSAAPINSDGRADGTIYIQTV